MGPRRRDRQLLEGRPLSPGLAVGTAFVYRDILQRNQDEYDITAAEIPEERSRYERAVARVREALREAADRAASDLGAEHAEVFEAHELMLRDPALIKDIEDGLQRELANVEYVVKHVFRRWEHTFRQIEDPVMRERAADMADLGRRILRALAGVHVHALEEMPEDSILVARRLLPSDTVALSRRSTAGVVLEAGGTASHAALLTRELGVPAVSRLPGLRGIAQTGDRILVDGFDGTVVVNPGEDELLHFRERVQQHDAVAAEARSRRYEPCATVDGTTVEVVANITCREDAVFARENGADGIGLFRIEGLYMSREALPTDDELITDLTGALEPLSDKPVTVRMLDVGGDKHLPLIDLAREQNPFLGRRGVRVLIEHPDLAATQFRALARLSEDYDLRILVPMVTVVDDMVRMRKLLEEAVAEVGSKAVPPLGAMVETPAAALCASELLQHSDFLSVGTNDLTQYTMAAGREDPRVDEYFIDDHSAVFRLLHLIAAEVDGAPLSVCGELAGRPEATGALVAAGFRSLSVAPSLVAATKHAVRQAGAR
jgi:phosphotransferase system enzyme I (PtsI)